MNTNRIDDPALRALEDQLAGLAPQLSAAEQQDLLYQCAFAAGRQAMVRPLRRWQAAVATLAVLLVSVSVPLASSRMTVAKNEAAPGPAAPPNDIVLVRPESEPDSVRPVVLQGQFDAWQLAFNSNDAVANNLKQLERSDPALRPLGVAALTRAALHQ